MHTHTVAAVAVEVMFTLMMLTEPVRAASVAMWLAVTVTVFCCWFYARSRYYARQRERIDRSYKQRR